MTREEEKVKASQRYREGREECGVKDPILLDEVEEAFYLGAEWADQNPIHKDVDLKKEIENYLFTYGFALMVCDSETAVYSIAKHFFELGLRIKENKK